MQLKVDKIHCNVYEISLRYHYSVYCAQRILTVYEFCSSVAYPLFFSAGGGGIYSSERGLPRWPRRRGRRRFPFPQSKLFSAEKNAWFTKLLADETFPLSFSLLNFSVQLMWNRHIS